MRKAVTPAALLQLPTPVWMKRETGAPKGGWWLGIHFPPWRLSPQTPLRSPLFIPRTELGWGESEGRADTMTGDHILSVLSLFLVYNSLAARQSHCLHLSRDTDIHTHIHIHITPPPPVPSLLHDHWKVNTTNYHQPVGVKQKRDAILHKVKPFLYHWMFFWQVFLSEYWLRPCNWMLPFHVIICSLGEITFCVSHLLFSILIKENFLG